MALRFPALAGRQSCHILESGSLHPPQAALRRFPRKGTGHNPREGNPKGRDRSLSPLCLEGVWGTVAYTVTALRFPALAGRQSCRFLESGPLFPPLAALGPLSPMFLVGV